MAYHIEASPPGVSIDDYRKVLKDVFAKWSKHANITAAETLDPTYGVAKINYRVKPPQDFDAGAIAKSVIPDGHAQGTIVDLNSGAWWGYPSDGITSILLHETGHALGLDDVSKTSDSVMFWQYSGKTDITAVDARDIVALYGSNGVPLPPDSNEVKVNASQFVSQDVPTTMVPGQSYDVTVVMKNTGNAVWTDAGQYFLGSQAPQDNNTWNVFRVPTGTVAAGASKTFSFTIKAPSTPGTYAFQRRVLQHGVEWFGDFTPVVQVVVASGPMPPDPPPVQTTTISITGPTDGLVIAVNGVQKFP